MSSDRNLSLGLLILRLGIAGYLATHGWGKLQMVLAGQYEMFGDPIGLGSKASLLLVTFAELVCALLVVIGAATRVAAIPVVITMLVAAFVAHGSDPWTMDAAARAFFSGASKSWASKQPALMYAAAFLGFVFTGAGRYSVDALFARKK
jgi:putative oxidoreductase